MSGEVKAIGASAAQGSTVSSAARQPAVSVTRAVSHASSAAASSAATVQQKAVKAIIPSQSAGVLQFGVDSSTSQLVIKIVDGNTSDIIRKIPSEQAEQVVAAVSGTPGVIVNGSS